MNRLIDIEDLTYSYNKGKNNEVRAIQNVSLEIESGDFVGIVGSSGSGKSTLLYLLAGLLRADSGKYTYNGIDMTKASDDKRAELRNRDLGIILQDFGLIGDRSALENVCLPLFFSNCRWRDIEKSGLSAMEKLKISEYKNKKVSELSGGQCQRVAIARALIHQPKLILADEPTGALDSENTRILMELLSEINKEGITVILVTHDLSTLTYCNKIYELSDGIIKTRKDKNNEKL